MPNLTIQRFLYRNLVQRPTVNRVLDQLGSAFNRIGLPYATGLTRNKARLFVSSDSAEIGKATEDLLSSNRNCAIRAVAIKAALSAKLSSKQITLLFSQIINKYGAQALLAFRALPAALAHGLTPVQTLHLFDQTLRICEGELANPFDAINHSLRIMTPNQFLDLLRRMYSETTQQLRTLEIQAFPEFKKFDECCTADIHFPRPGKPCYSLFAPSWHYKTGLLCDEMIEDLRNPNTTLLSVGAGPAHLERTLVLLGIDPSQITLADIEPELLPTGFEHYEFDMHQSWPYFRAKFDYIIFPESCFFDTNDEVASLLHVIKSALFNLKPGGQIRLSPFRCPVLVNTPEVFVNEVVEILTGAFDLEYYFNKNINGDINSLVIKLL